MYIAAERSRLSRPNPLVVVLQRRTFHLPRRVFHTVCGHIFRGHLLVAQFIPHLRQLQELVSVFLICYLSQICSHYNFAYGKVLLSGAIRSSLFQPWRAFTVVKAMRALSRSRRCNAYYQLLSFVFLTFVSLDAPLDLASFVAVVGKSMPQTNNRQTI
ncbi:uncharacterized protein EDB91DRAFT_184663 [Suillus paluster]|uniref:uncharacterized protein n=1 Tax=Suillus paluster TaxID=48578 RepID=UPI001B865865|nr:uncharacterized protein EDB91DRAFT_808893 [Suillus paluster]XP_041169896.1 uncharacterized protein EDB91DRAFT_184663 [Suillus paluster]KAG1717568.1 hypothetical protein EDB91DRAFT_808893 [Suillus paluster]KAG1723071.1 hypothetical protein EDB91DRAFT_184663 [Suillus paluster]